jgi:hypothetical protein
LQEEGAAYQPIVVLATNLVALAERGRHMLRHNYCFGFRFRGRTAGNERLSNSLRHSALFEMSAAPSFLGCSDVMELSKSRHRTHLERLA